MACWLYYQIPATAYTILWNKSLNNLLFAYRHNTQWVTLNMYNIVSSNFDKGGLIWESLSLWLKSQNKGANSLSCAFPLLRRISWHLFFWDLSKSDKYFEIKPPLAGTYTCREKTNETRGETCLDPCCFSQTTICLAS